MKSPALAIKNLVEGVITNAWPVYVSQRPAKEKNIITCLDAGGSERILLMDGDDVWQPLVGITIYSTSYEEGYEKYDEIRSGLKRVDDFEEDGAKYCGVWLLNDLSYIGKDENDRHIFTIVVDVKRQEI